MGPAALWWPLACDEPVASPQLFPTRMPELTHVSAGNDNFPRRGEMSKILSSSWLCPSSRSFIGNPIQPGVHCVSHRQRSSHVLILPVVFGSRSVGGTAPRLVQRPASALLRIPADVIPRAQFSGSPAFPLARIVPATQSSAEQRETWDESRTRLPRPSRLAGLSEGGVRCHLQPRIAQHARVSSLGLGLADHRNLGTLV